MPTRRPKNALLAVLTLTGLGAGLALTSSVAGVAAFAPPEARADAPSYKLALEAPKECKAGAECVATARLEATGEYHINETYPYKLKVEETAGLEFLGKDPDGKHVFSKRAGDFRKEGAKVGLLTVRFRAAKAGTYTLKGIYKLSICSEKTCQLETQELAASVVAQ